MPNNTFFFIGMAIAMAVFGFQKSLFNIVINYSTEASYRASIVAVVAIIRRISSIFINLCIGYLITFGGPRFSMVTCACLLIIASVVTFYTKMHGIKKDAPLKVFFNIT